MSCMHLRSTTLWRVLNAACMLSAAMLAEKPESRSQSQNRVSSEGAVRSSGSGDRQVGTHTSVASRNDLCQLAVGGVPADPSGGLGAGWLGELGVCLMMLCSVNQHMLRVQCRCQRFVLLQHVLLVPHKQAATCPLACSKLTISS